MIFAKYFLLLALIAFVVTSINFLACFSNKNLNLKSITSKNLFENEVTEIRSKFEKVTNENQKTYLNLTTINSITTSKENKKIDKVEYFGDTSKRTESLPFVTGDTFRLFSDAALDNIDSSLPEHIFKKQMPIIFIKIDYLQKFFNVYFSKFVFKIIIITHNGANPVTEKYRKYLEKDKIVAWFAQNPEFYHSKLIPIPVGFINIHHNIDYFKMLQRLRKENSKPWNERKTLLYIHYNVKTNVKAREKFLTRFQNLSGVKILKTRIHFEEFFKNLNDSKFVLCPRGSGIDTHRFYETTLMGGIPIVENSTLNPIYNQTTALILPNLNLLTHEMLQNPGNYIKNMNFNKDTIFMEYWLKKIYSFRRNTNY